MLIFLLSYFGITLGLRSIILYRKTKINTGDVFLKGTGKRKAGKLILVAMFLMIVVAINFIWIPGNYKYLLPIGYLEIGLIQTIGFVLSIVGQLMGFIAQLQMKNSWRLGVDNNTDIELVTNGLFSISRNPIYLFLGISFLGFFLIAPNIISIACCSLMMFGVNEKIKDEEQFLSDKFGNLFLEYQKSVRRWI